MKEKIARICWNGDWIAPSGPYGKNKSGYEAEKKSGFGHEEWLFNPGREINGYHYSYVEPVNKGNYDNISFKLHLFTFHPQFGKVYLGFIDNVHCLSQSEADYALRIYKNKGWIKQMKEDVDKYRGKSNLLDGDDGKLLFNIRFKLSDVHVELANDRLRKLSKDDPNTKASYYRLYNYKQHFVFDKSNYKIIDYSQQKNISINSVHFEVFAHTCDYEPIHKQMQVGIINNLKAQSYTNINHEVNHVDIIAINPAGQLVYFEVKTANEARKCIREAFGQILEYSYYPGNKQADVLYIVGRAKLTNDDKDYLKYIRKIMNTNLWYRYYSIKEDKLFMPE